MRNYIIIAFVLLIINNQISAQQDLKTRLEGKERLQDIMKIVDEYYEGKSDDWRGVSGEAPKLKHWKRWEWYMSGRLGPNDELVRIQDSLIIAKKELDKRFPIDPDRDVNSTWNSVGPSSTTSGIGRADRIAFHPTDPDIFYVGTPAGGLWRTTNGGTSWTPLTDDIPSTGISGIVVDWNNPSTIYILTGDGDSANIGGFVFQFGYARTSIGVLKSTDSGATWIQTGTLDENPFLPFKLVQSPTSPNTLLAATSIGVFRTTDSGVTWVKTLSDDIYDIEFKPGSTTVYAASNDKIYYSLFAGNSWAESSFDIGPTNPNRIELAVSPASPNLVYALVGRTSPPDGVYGGTYRSTNSGLSFALRSTTPNILGSAADGSDDSSIATYAHSIAVSNTDENTVVTGGIRIWNSGDGGTTYPNQKSGYHSDIHELAYNPLDGKLYSCNDGGVYVSSDDGENWTSFLTGFRASQIFHMAGTPLDNNYFLIGLQDNGVKLRSNNTSTWDHVNGADGFDQAFNPTDKTEFYSTINQGAKRFWNGGNNSEPITPTTTTTDWFCTIRTHVSDENILFYGSSNVQVSPDKGQSWTATGASGSWVLETCPSNSNRIYAAGAVDFDVSSNGTLSRTDNQGSGWTSLENNAGFPASNLWNKITDIAVNPGNSNTVYVTFGGFFDGVKVYRSTNAGANWVDFSGTLPNIPINAIIVNAAADQVYIGTDLGVFYRHSSMNDWMPFNNALPNTPVTDLYIDEDNDEIYASTFGRGAWKNDLAEGCPVNLILGGSMVGDHFYQSTTQTTITSDVKGGIATKAFIKAGKRIILATGFWAEKQTLFRAYIGGCGEGDIPE